MVQIKSNELRIAVIGDIHDQWHEDDDRQALAALGVDLVLFVGDFGNEVVELVQQIADLPFPKAVILGNHDAWYTASHWGRKKSPYDHQKEDRVQAQLDILGDRHVGYGYLDLPEFELSIIGSRPFSWGGEQWKNKDFLYTRYGVSDFEESLALIKRAIQACAYDHVIFLGHNGPTGLGTEPEDICGRDWHPLGGDFGDPDFEQAIAAAQAMGKIVSLVAFGHMHHNLRHRKDRLRTRTQLINQTLYLNAAHVPRIRQIQKQKNSLMPVDRQHHFSVVTCCHHQVVKVEHVWVSIDRSIQESMVIWQS